MLLPSIRTRHSSFSSPLFLILQCLLILSEKAPLAFAHLTKHDRHHQPPLEFQDYLLRTALSVLLVLLGGIFAGLTIGLMGLDPSHLEILQKSGTAQERAYAAKIMPIRRNTHLLLCTLLLANTVVNETLPIVLDRMIGGGWKAVAGSSALIVMFGEILPQAVCSRYGLAIGAHFAPCVRVLICLLYVLAWPISKLLDYLLGQGHGIVYRRAELKELVSQHETQVLSSEEVRIIRGAIDLRDKVARDAMTSLDNAYMLSASEHLDNDTVRQIVSKGHSRIPVYADNDRTKVVGMLLVKKLIMLWYTQQQPNLTKITSIPLHPLSTVSANTPLFEILSEFQQGGSHMALVVENIQEESGGSPNIIGLITLEDVLEELLGSEIIDETDEYIDIAAQIRVVRDLRRVLTYSRSRSSTPRTALAPNLRTTQASKVLPPEAPTSESLSLRISACNPDYPKWDTAASHLLPDYRANHFSTSADTTTTEDFGSSSPPSSSSHVPWSYSQLIDHLNKVKTENGGSASSAETAAERHDADEESSLKRLWWLHPETTATTETETTPLLPTTTTTTTTRNGHNPRFNTKLLRPSLHFYNATPHILLSHDIP